MSKKNILLIVVAMLALAINVYMFQKMHGKIASANPFFSISVQTGNKWSYDAQNLWYFETGRSQSPIDITPATVVEMVNGASLLLSYEPTVRHVLDTGHNIEVEVEGEAIINRRSFKLGQFHFHTPSEHTIDGAHYPLELHFIHTAQNGQLAVVSVLFEEGAPNEAIAHVLEALATGETVSTALSVNALLPADKSYYHYRGSLTTPPLTENVEWYVLTNTVQLSAEQLIELQSYYKGNNRNIQPINDRSILYYKGL